MTMAQDATHPTGVSDDSERGGSAVAHARMRKARAALESKREGWTWEEIAETWGYPTGRAAKVAAERAMADGLLDTESQEFMRKMASARLEGLLKKAWSKADDDESPDQLGAIRECRQIVMDHSKLMGYIAPAEVSIHNPMAAEVEAFVGRVISKNRPSLQEADILEMEPDADGVFTSTEG